MAKSSKNINSTSSNPFEKAIRTEPSSSSLKPPVAPPYSAPRIPVRTPQMFRHRQDTVPLWSMLEDLLAECKLMKKFLPSMRQNGTLGTAELKYAMMYIEGFLNHADPREVFTLYELIKMHAILMRNGELGQRKH